MSLNRTLWALAVGKPFFKHNLCVPFPIWNNMSKHMPGFLTRGDVNKPPAPGSQHQNQGFTALPFSLVSFILPRTNLTFVFPRICLPTRHLEVQSQYCTQTTRAKAEMGGTTSTIFILCLSEVQQSWSHKEASFLHVSHLTGQHFKF